MGVRQDLDDYFFILGVIMLDILLEIKALILELMPIISIVLIIILIRITLAFFEIRNNTKEAIEQLKALNSKINLLTSSSHPSKDSVHNTIDNLDK